MSLRCGVHALRQGCASLLLMHDASQRHMSVFPSINFQPMKVGKAPCLQETRS